MRFRAIRHWEGAIQMQQEVRFTWISPRTPRRMDRSIDIGRGIPDAPLSAISVKDGTVKFSLWASRILHV